MRNIIKTILIVVLVGFFVVIIAVNSGQTVDLNLVFYSFTKIPLGLALTLFFVLGFLVSTPLLIGTGIYYRHKAGERVAKIREKARKELEACEEKLKKSSGEGFSASDSRGRKKEVKSIWGDEK
jgi:uncharacterized integral membrane protein